MVDTDMARATILKAREGFGVAFVLRRGEQIDAWRLDSLKSLEEAEEAVKAFAKQYNLPWEQVEVISP